MRLSLHTMILSSAILWGGAVLLVRLINLAVPSYGASFLAWVSTIYPGFHNSRTLVDVIVGTCYGLVDGAGGGLLFGPHYNWFAGEQKPA